MGDHAVGIDAFREPWPAMWSAAIGAAAEAVDPAPHLRPLLRTLGFDELTCITLAPGIGERSPFVWSTLADAWTARYREQGYARLDPRVTLTAPRLSPIVWDAADFDADGHVQRYLADASRYGVRSGFAVSFRDAAQVRVVVAFDSAISPLPEPHCAWVVARMGDLMLLAAALHERVLRSRCARGGGVAGIDHGRLTARERDCLRMAANGLTSADIGGKLGIAERTVNFHMRNVLRKLEALNRSEAIAKAVARGVVDAAPFAQRSV